jgi:peptidoglycan/LPS O-acetylase OafA/YrhL
MQTPFDQRGNNFDIIRMALAILVIFSHSYPLATGSELREPFNILTRHQATGGHIAVDLFFIISGFLIAASYERSKTIWSYLKKRIYRIYPAFIVAMILSALIIVPASGGHVVGGSSPAGLLDFVAHTLRLTEFSYTGVFHGNPFPDVLNGSTWSIAFEFWCYIGVILLGTTGMLRSNRVLTALFLISIAISVLFSVYHWTPSGKLLGRIFGYPPFWARLLPMYVSGIVLYRLRDRLSLKTSWIAVACAGLVAAALLPHGWPLLFPVVGGYLVLVLAFHPAIRLHNWNRFGDFSYGTYLYGFPVEQLVTRWLGASVSHWKLFFIAAPVAVGCAIVSWHLVEKWFLRSSHRTALDRAAVEATVST